MSVYSFFDLKPSNSPPTGSHQPRQEGLPRAKQRNSPGDAVQPPWDRCEDVCGHVWPVRYAAQLSHVCPSAHPQHACWGHWFRSQCSSVASLPHSSQVRSIAQFEGCVCYLFIVYLFYGFDSVISKETVTEFTVSAVQLFANQGWVCMVHFSLFW